MSADNLGAEVIELSGTKIVFDQLKGDGPFRFRLRLEEPWVDKVLQKTDAEAKGPVTVSLELSEQYGKSFLIRGELEGWIRVPCARCLEPSEVSASAELCATFVPEHEYRQELMEIEGEEFANEEDLSAALGESDRFPYRGQELDLRTLLTEQILVAYPMRVLCELGEACLGLCSQCGRNLNKLSSGERSACPQCGTAKDPAAGDEEELSPQQKAWQRALREFGQDQKN